MFGSFRQQIILHFLKRLLFLSVFPLYFVKIFQGSSRWYCSSQISYFLFGWWRQVTEFYFKIGDCGLLFYFIFQFQKGEINHNTSTISGLTVHTRYILLRTLKYDDEIINWQGRFSFAFLRTEIKSMKWLW